ncbi:MAG: hypothetical protein IT453_15725 [Planctomycetes bacterium]|nr:hypothetical protein [Planctomycetota bacterium]
MAFVDLSFRFDPWFLALPKSPLDRGRVHRVVLRTGFGQRATPGSIRVEAGRGAVGDSWPTHKFSLAAKNEIAIINVHVLRSLADGDEAKMPLSGDQIQADLDLSEANLPVGTRLSIGSAVLEVTDLPHRPCEHFVERFGATAAKKVARANRKGRRGRGVLCRVVVDGEIRDGDEIAVQRPPPTSG